MSTRLGTPATFAQAERQDYHIIAKFELDGDVNFVPVQLKEWASDFLHSPSSLQSELNQLSKYVDSSDLAVVFHLNRETTIKLSELTLPTTIGELWFVGCTEPSQNHWTLVGDVLKEPFANDFTHPEA